MYGHHQAMLDNLTDEQAGRVIKTVLTYLNTGEVAELQPLENLVFNSIKPDVDKSIADYQAICIRNKENRHKGLEKAKNVPPPLYDDSDDYETRRAKARAALLGNRPP